MSIVLGKVRRAAYEYKKKFAYLPKDCSDGSRVWFENYYVVHCKRIVWNIQTSSPLRFDHAGKGLTSIDSYQVEIISESEYLMRKLIGTL